MDDFEDLADEFEETGTAARSLQDSLAGLPGALSTAGSAARDAQGRFLAAGQGATEAGGAMQKSGGLMGGLAGAIAGVGTAALALATGPLPSATQAGQELGQAIGGALTGAADKAAGALSKLGPEGEAVGAALQGVALVAAATIGTLLTLAGLAVDVSQHFDLMRDRFAALAGSAAGGAAVTAMVEKLSTTLPFATGEIQGWALALQGAGLKGAQLESSIKAIAAATALMGAQGGAAAENLIKKLAEGGEGATKLLEQIQKGGGKSNKLLADMGLSTKDLAAAMGMSEAAFSKATISADQMNAAITKALQKKGAGPLDDLSNTLPDILGKAREGFLSLFQDLGPSVKPFMKEIKELFGEFSKGGTAIKILKPIVTSVFGALFSAATSAAHAIHAGFLLAEIAALKIYIAVKPVIDAIKKIGQSATFINLAHHALLALKVILIAVAVVAAIVLAPFIIGAAIFVVAVGLVVAAIGLIIDWVGDCISAIGDLAGGAADAAANFISGLVGGIASGAGAVVDAVSNLASGALSAFTGALGIHSPSTVLWEHGEDNMAGAVAGGVDKGKVKVDDAMARMGSGKPGGGGGEKKKGGGGGGRGKIADKIEINFHGSAKEFPEFKEQVNAWFEELAAEAPK